MKAYRAFLMLRVSFGRHLYALYVLIGNLAE